MEHTFINLEDKESSTPGDSDKGSRTEVPQIGAAGQHPVEQGVGETPLTEEKHSSPGSISPENLEGLTEIGSLGLQVTRKNCCGAAKKQAGKARLMEAPTGDSGCGQPLPAPGGWPQKPGTSGARQRRGLCSAELKSTERKGHPQGPSKRQRPARALPRVSRLRGPNRVGNLVTPGPLGRASGWQLYARITRGVKSPRKTS